MRSGNLRLEVSRALAQKDVGCTFAGDVFHTFIAQGAHIDIVPKMLPGTEQDRADGEMEFVDQGGAQILPNGGYTAAETDVAFARCRAGHEVVLRRIERPPNLAHTNGRQLQLT